MATTRSTPFPAEAALFCEPESATSSTAQHLPGEPRIACSDRKGVNTFLQRELSTPLVDDLYPWLRGLVTQQGNNISSIHRQRLKGREIIPSEDPKLHMVWHKHKIYIKPIPASLLSHNVWETFLGCPGLPRPVEPVLAQNIGLVENVSSVAQGEPVEPKHSAELTTETLPYHQPYQTQTPTPRPPTSSSLPSNGPPAEVYDFNDSDSEHLPHPSPPAPPEQTLPSPQIFDRTIALGFLRSYAYLIRHPSDLKVAREVGLIPDLEPTSAGPPAQITWTKWAIFISHFQSLPDSAVSKRYHFGHLRLGRLDWAVRMRFLHHVFTSFLTSMETKGPKKKKIKPRWYYLQPYWSIPVLLEGLLAYFLFAFATASLVLSAMQVSLAIPPQAYVGLSSGELDGGGDGNGQIAGGSYTLGLWRFFWVFSNATIYVSAIMCVGMIFALLFPYSRKLLRVILGTLRRGRGGKED